MKINPLNVINTRRVFFLSPHFVVIKLNAKSTHNSENLLKWIHQNLKHKYYFNIDYILINNRLTKQIIIGFERKSEASYFSLACSYLDEIC